MSLKQMWDNVHLNWLVSNLKLKNKKLERELEETHYKYDREKIQLEKEYEKKNKRLYNRCEMLAEDNRRLACLLRKYEKGDRNVTKGTSQKVARKEQNNK